MIHTGFEYGGRKPFGFKYLFDKGYQQVLYFELVI